jgi:hypothetical protein
MIDFLLEYFFNTLIKFSEYQLPDLKRLGSTDEEIETAKKQGTTFVTPYYSIDYRQSKLFKNEINQFQWYVQKYKNGDPETHKYINDTEYQKYIDFIRKTAVKCNDNCNCKVCPFCRACKVDHQKDNCSDEKWKAVKETHSTWRSYFTEYDDMLKLHENAILRSYYDSISHKLWAKDCPCHEILYDNQRKDSFIIKMLKHYDSRMLDLNVQLIKDRI